MALPDEILLDSVLTFLSTKEVILTVSKVNKKLRKRLMQSESLWKSYCLLNFNFPQEANSWKKVKFESFPLNGNSWFLLYKEVTKYSKTSRKLIEAANFSTKKSRLRKRQKLLETNRLNFRGIYTDGGCDGESEVEKLRFWVDNLYAHGTCSNYCSLRSEMIETFGEPCFGSSEKIARKRAREKRRRKALLWIFSGSRIPARLLESVDNYELETLVLEAIEQNIDELVKVKCKLWEKQMKKQRSRISMIPLLRRLHCVFKKLFHFSEHCNKFTQVYNSFSRTKTRDFVEYFKKYTSIKGVARTFLFTFALMGRTVVKYVHFVNHSERLRRVLKLSQRKFRFKNGLLEISRKILPERLEMEEKSKSLPFQTLSTENDNEIMLKSEERVVISDEWRWFVFLDAIEVSRVGSFTSPVSVGAIMATFEDFSSSDFSKLKRSDFSKQLLTIKTFQDLSDSVKAGLLPPIECQYKLRQLHIVEFKVCSESLQPLIWFNFDSEPASRFGLRLRYGRAGNLLSSSLKTGFVYKMKVPRLLKMVNVKLISPKSAVGISNIDVSSVSFYGKKVRIS